MERGKEQPVSSAPAQVQQICWYPQSHATARPIREELAAVAQNKDRCSSIYLDTVEGMSDDFPYTEGADHHQGLARSHKLADGSVYFSSSPIPKPTRAIRAACPATGSAVPPMPSTC
jgi:hypothetical protein